MKKTEKTDLAIIRALKKTARYNYEHCDQRLGKLEDQIEWIAAERISSLIKHNEKVVKARDFYEDLMIRNGG